MKTITRLEDIPTFEGYEEEDAFWQAHALSPELWAEGQRGDSELDKSLSELVSVKVVPTKPKKARSTSKRVG